MGAGNTTSLKQNIDAMKAEIPEKETIETPKAAIPYPVNVSELDAETFEGVSVKIKAAAALVTQGAYSDALVIYDECLASLCDENNVSRAFIFGHMAHVYQLMGKIDASLQLYKRMLEIEIAVFGGEHPCVGTTYCDIAALLQSRGQFREALDLFQRALTIYKTSLHDNHSDVASAYNNIAVMHHKQGAYKDALESYAFAKDIYKKNNHPDLAVTYQNMGMVQHTMGNINEALRLYETALSIRTASLGADHRLNEKLQVDINRCRNIMDIDSDCETEVEQFRYPDSQSEFF